MMPHKDSMKTLVCLYVPVTNFLFFFICSFVQYHIKIDQNLQISLSV